MCDFSLFCVFVLSEDCDVLLFVLELCSRHWNMQVLSHCNNLAFVSTESKLLLRNLMQWQIFSSPSAIRNKRAQLTCKCWRLCPQFVDFVVPPCHITLLSDPVCQSPCRASSWLYNSFNFTLFLLFSNFTISKCDQIIPL